MFIYAFSGIAFGLLGRLENQEGGEGARRGFLIGLLPGLVAGVAAGFIVYRAADWLTQSVYPEMALSIFEGFAGLLIGASLGCILYWLTRD
jgi:NhaP-type Na+/H+ or K+/H+ antiporter